MKYRFGEMLYTAAASEGTVHVIQLGSVNWRDPADSISARYSVYGTECISSMPDDHLDMITFGHPLARPKTFYVFI